MDRALYFDAELLMKSLVALHDKKILSFTYASTHGGVARNRESSCNLPSVAVA